MQLFVYAIVQVKIIFMKAATILFRTPEKSDTRNEKAEKEEKSGKELKRKKR